MHNLGKEIGAIVGVILSWTLTCFGIGWAWYTHHQSVINGVLQTVALIGSLTITILTARSLRRNRQ